MGQGTLRQLRGRNTNGWEIEIGRFRQTVAIPGGVTATIHEPPADVASVNTGGSLKAKSHRVKFLRAEIGCAVYAAGAGRYEFTSGR